MAAYACGSSTLRSSSLACRYGPPSKVATNHTTSLQSGRNLPRTFAIMEARALASKQFWSEQLAAWRTCCRVGARAEQISPLYVLVGCCSEYVRVCTYVLVANVLPLPLEMLQLAHWEPRALVFGVSLERRVLFATWLEPVHICSMCACYRPLPRLTTPYCHYLPSLVMVRQHSPLTSSAMYPKHPFLRGHLCTRRSSRAEAGSFESVPPAFVRC